MMVNLLKNLENIIYPLSLYFYCSFLDGFPSDPTTPWSKKVDADFRRRFTFRLSAWIKIKVWNIKDRLEKRKSYINENLLRHLIRPQVTYIIGKYVHSYPIIVSLFLSFILFLSKPDYISEERKTLDGCKYLASCLVRIRKKGLW